MKSFVRGASVHIRVWFKDASGDPVVPSAANVTLSFMPKNNTLLMPPRTFLTYPLAQNPTLNATDWFVDWDSSISEPCIVFGNAVTASSSGPIAAQDFSFRLTANTANKQLAGDDDSWYTDYWQGYGR